MRISYSGTLNPLKGLSDEIVYHPVKYKVLFGEKADLSLQAKFKNGDLLDVAQKLFEISKSGLEKRNILVKNEKYNETFYLKDLEQNLSNGHSPADLLISKYNGEWKKNINKIYEEEIF